jgi:hypothetical protein
LLIPVVLVLAYGFYRVAERPFLSPALRAAIDRDLSAEPAPASATGTVAPSLSASS